ncbi:hypothetical protein ACLIA0_13200 [Bacillaceae bacterium W0354]
MFKQSQAMFRQLQIIFGQLQPMFEQSHAIFGQLQPVFEQLRPHNLFYTKISPHYH